MILITDEKRELGIQSLHDVCTATIIFMLKLDAPVDQDTLDEEVQADEKLNRLLFLLLGVKSLSERIDLEDLT